MDRELERAILHLRSFGVPVTGKIKLSGTQKLVINRLKGMAVRLKLERDNLKLDTEIPPR